MDWSMYSALLDELKLIRRALQAIAAAHSVQRYTAEQLKRMDEMGP